MAELKYPDESYRIRGAFFEVYREMGPGFVEPIYQESLANEFVLQQIPATPQREVAISYKGVPLQQTYRPDFFCYD